MISKVREVVFPNLKFKEEKRTFSKVEKGKVDFFFLFLRAGEGTHWMILNNVTRIYI